jgi:L-lysine exporter family protein LysE/ArgO
METHLSVMSAGLLLSLSLIVAIGPQNLHVLRMALSRQHVALTVAVCALTDVALIAVGVAGLAQLGRLDPRVHTVMVALAVGFLVLYGWGAAQRAWRGAVQVDMGASGAQGYSRSQAVWAALGFSWLNPHAWLDTAVLVGGASMAYHSALNGSGSWVFGLGAALGSAAWFVGFGVLAWALGGRLNRPQVWRALDTFVALSMWAIALHLVWQWWADMAPLAEHAQALQAAASAAQRGGAL